MNDVKSLFDISLFRWILWCKAIKDLSRCFHLLKNIFTLCVFHCDYKIKEWQEQKTNEILARASKLYHVFFLFLFFFLGHVSDDLTVNWKNNNQTNLLACCAPRFSLWSANLAEQSISGLYSFLCKSEPCWRRLKWRTAGLYKQRGEEGSLNRRSFVLVVLVI